jgi:predicted alpha/beta superfamily hydrolase
MKVWIESTKESDPKVINTMKGSIVLLLFMFGTIFGGIIGASIVLLEPTIFKYVFMGICTL